MSQQRQNARRTSKHSTVVRDEQKQVSEQSEPSSLPPIRPSKDDHAAWLAYWQKQNQPWRTEPEISPERRAELEQRRALIPDVKKGIYPFKGMKLDRADVEWLLATHEGGPVKWRDEKERERDGLDVRGADLQHADLHRLPLTRLRGGLTLDERLKATEEQCSSAVVLMRGADLRGAQLEGANLSGAQLKEANFSYARLERADLSEAQLEGANLFRARLEGAYLFRAQLKEANFSYAQLKGADLSEAQLERADLSEAQLERADLSEAYLERASLSYAQLKGANFSYAQLKEASLSYAQLKEANFSYAQLKEANLYWTQLEGAYLFRAQLEEANFSYAQLKGADLSEAQLERANLEYAHLEGADLLGAHLEGARCCRVFFDTATRLNGVTLSDKKHGSASLADISWGEANLSVINWSQVLTLGDEYEAQQQTRDGEKKARHLRLNEYQTAVRANRQLAVALQTQGLNEYATRFAYRANVLQRKVLWYQLFPEQEQEQKKRPWYRIVQQWLIEGLRSIRKFGSYIFSLFLDILAGYGYRPGRALGWYLLFVLSYAGTYFGLAHVTKLHSFIGAIIFSITAFHGRGFFPGGFGYDDLVTILAATEAVIGLLIELSFIATFTQRFFGK